MDIGSKIKERRLALGKTLEVVGDAVGVGKSTVRKWEQGMIKNMRRDKISLLAAALEMDPVELVDYQSQQISVLTEKELQLIAAFRAADGRAQEDALRMLLDHPAAQKKENLA